MPNLLQTIIKLNSIQLSAIGKYQGIYLSDRGIKNNLRHIHRHLHTLGVDQHHYFFFFFLFFVNYIHLEFNCTSTVADGDGGKNDTAYKIFQVTKSVLKYKYKQFCMKHDPEGD